MFRDPPLVTQITWTKVILPRRRTDLLTRRRLVNLFHELLDYRLIIITAPAGYGKTSLLVDVAHQIETPVCWYTIDSLDQDLQRFVAHFIAAIAHRFPNFGPRSAAILENTTLETSSVDRLVATIVNEAYEQIQEHFIFVLDDFHLINNKKITYFINQFTQLVDEDCHLVISSRSLLSLPDLVLMVGRAQVTGLGLNDLAFETDEIQALIRQNYDVPVAQTVAEKLARETEGWITGLLLSAHTLWQGMADRLRLVRIAGVDMYDYLAQQVLEQQSPAVQDFLLRTSLLEEIDAELCLAVLGQAEYPNGENWSDLINTVVQNNLFVLPLEDRESGLRFHHLFQSFLQRRLEAERPDEKATILRQLAGAWAERQDWEKAHDLYQRLGDTAATARLIKQAGLSLVESGRFTTLYQWIDALPAGTLASFPALISLQGYAAVMLGQVKQGLALLNQAETTFRAASDTASLLRTLIWRAGVKRLLGKNESSLADADEALILAEENGSWLAFRAEALRAKGQSLSKMRQLPEAIGYFDQSLAISRTLHDAEMTARVHLELGLAHMRAGHHQQVLNHYNLAADHWKKTGNIVRQANLLNNLAVLHHRGGDYQQAVSIFEEALSCAEQSGHARMVAFILCGIGDLYGDLEAGEAAWSAYGRAREAAHRLEDRSLLLYLDLAEAALVRLTGNPAQAHDRLDSAARRIRASASHYEQGHYHLEVGRLALAKGHARKAVRSLKRGARHFADGDHHIETSCASLDLARAYQMVKDRQAAIDHLGYALRLAAKLENQHRLVVAGREAVRLLETYQRDATLGKQATQLLQRISQFEQDIPILRRHLRRQTSAVPFVPPRLAIRAFGKVQVRLDGTLVTGSEWQTQRRVRELLFYLLLHPEGLTRAAIGTAFWPDSTPAQLRLQFKNTIYRLRRALDKEAVLFDPDEERYYFNRQMDYEYDVEMFQKAIEAARAAKMTEQRITAYENAIDLYRGSYLPGIDGIWILPERERLARAFIEANLKLARLHLGMGKPGLTLQYCQALLAEDPSLEEAHRLAMQAYAASGNRAAVIHQFELCQQTLLAELDVSVSPQTRRLYESLTR